MEHVDPAEPVLGIRAWEARTDGRLCSVWWPGKWEPGVNTGRCNAGMSPESGPHEAPGSDCGCGLHAYREVNAREHELYERPDIVIGTIAAWGRIAPSVDGFRAEQARLLAIGASPQVRRLERRAAIRYGVPLIPMAGLADYSAAHARPTGFARPMSGAVILVVDCGPASARCMGELRAGLHQLVDRLRLLRIDMVVCGEGAIVVPLCGEFAQRAGQLHAAVDQLVCDTAGPALARGLERARGRVLWAHRRWSIDIIMATPSSPDHETCDQLRSCRRDGVRVLSICPSPDCGWDRRCGEQLPIRPGGDGDLAEAIRDACGRLVVRNDQWPADWTRHQIAFPGILAVVGAGRML